MNKKIKKIITKGLIASVLFIYLPINSTAGTLLEDTRYETFEGNNIQIDNILEEVNVDLEIEGNTLVNLSETKELLNQTGTHYDDIYLCEIDKIKPNTIYTVLYDFECNINFTFETCYFGYSTTSPFRMIEQFSGNRHYAKKGENIGSFNLTETQLQDAKNADAKYFQVRVFIDNEKLAKQYSVKNVRLLEGDWTSKEAPEYFNGMKSVGQDDENGHKIEILSRNKNLFDKTKFTPIMIDGKEMYNYKALHDFVPQPLKETSYTVSFRYKNPNNCSWANICIYYSNVTWGTAYNILSVKEGDLVKLTSVKGNLFKYIGFTTESGKELYIYDVMVEENSDATNYVEHKLNKKEISLNEPLRGLPNGIKDKFVKIDGKWYIERNCGEILFDRNSYVSIHDNSSTIFIRCRVGLPANAKYNALSSVVGEAEYLAENIVVIKSIPPASGSPSSSSGLYSGSTLYNSIPVCYISVEKSKLNTSDIAGFKNWLDESKIKVIYELATPIYEPLEIAPTINTYFDTTHVFNDSVIPANMKVVIDRVANRAQEAINVAKTTPTIENLALARMWINLMQDSILKDGFQEEVNGILQVEDLEIEKKKSSANLDLYIKTKNTLSLSLDTNSVTFDNYSGVEDVELLNAVNLTVNSSLPYSLNAYMEEGFYNSDKTSSLEFNSLNIRENTETAYKQFTNIKEKVILKDNCSDGNEKYHTIDLKLNGNNAHKTDVYKTVIKFEIEQK